MNRLCAKGLGFNRLFLSLPESVDHDKFWGDAINALEGTTEGTF